jgi:hypothetical protein
MQLWVKGKSYWACHGEVLAFSSVEVLGAALGLQISGVGYAVVNRGCTVVGDRRLRHSRWSASERFATSLYTSRFSYHASHTNLELVQFLRKSAPWYLPLRGLS